MTDETETLTVDAEQLSDLTETLEAVQRLCSGDADASYSAEVELPADDAAAIRSVVSAVGDAPDPTPDAATTDGGTASRDSPGRPSTGEIQTANSPFDPPRQGTIRYGVLALLCWHTSETGNGFVSRKDLLDGPCPYHENQIRSANSDLFLAGGATVRRLNPADDPQVRYVYRPSSAAREHVQETGRFYWPDDTDFPDEQPENPPYQPPE